MELFRQNVQPPGERPEATDVEKEEAERTHVQRLTKIFQDSWEENRKEGDPDVSFTLYFAGHGRAEDVHPNLRKELQEADIFMPEDIFWTEQVVRNHNKEAKGEDVFAPLLSRYNIALRNAMRESGVVVELPDIPADFPDAKEQRAALSNASRERWHLPFDEAVDDFDTATRNVATATRAREHEILGNIPACIRKALDENKDLRKRQSLKVVMTYGGAHTSIYHALDRAGANVERHKRHDGSVVYGHSSELLRNYVLGAAGSAPDRELAARGLTDLIFLNAIAPIIEGGVKDETLDELTRVARLFNERFTIEELRDLWDTYRVHKDRSVILAKLNEKGLHIPKTREELDELLQSNRKP